ncbi:hypothetical protein TCAL_13311 [Tigriopus californicus]|uniref:GPS domain-containing protein n=1 Tax=Tigriopus californicus TaxID=6832 RepID=A0A553NXE0_TIGCA|nr:latrophilin Cirl-like [Tigriopus californicus]TRY70105.1 hypothetical protein TCAL_13311 [Tigriopus californicus]|eukprot:TCALIF_13311-PA protein Name:"Similar to Cirl Latrophilin Cirl (Drosophila persimilis)" AED:0.01 eAED:0.01 QI:376/0.75/0.8/1/1/1/5/20/808
MYPTPSPYEAPSWATSSTTSSSYDLYKLGYLSPKPTAPTHKPVRPRNRVPITASPKPETTTKLENLTKEEKLVSNITARFISSSLTSTNIMDTSEAPIVLTSSPQPQISSSLLTTTSIPSTSSTLRTTESTLDPSTVMDSTTAKSINPDATTGFSKSISYLPSFSPNIASDVLITTHVISESDLEGPVRFCPPRVLRTLEWPLTRINQEVSMACPMGTQGKARWKCSNDSEWETMYPDLSGCKSLWLIKIHEQLKRKVSLVHLAKEMAHYTAFNGLFGGDVMALIDAIGVMTEKMLYELPEIPTIQQKEAIVMEIVQSIIKTASIMVSPQNKAGWMDLGPMKQRRTMTFFSRTLKAAGLLLPQAVKENQEITVSSPNILMSVKKMNFNHMIHMRFPSHASKATKEWMSYQDTIDVPSLVMMENMDRSGAEMIFFAFKDVASLIGFDQHEGIQGFINSHIVFASMKVKHKPLLPQPLKMTFEHIFKNNVTNPQCVFWDERLHEWSRHGCKLVDTNQTHSECLCGHLGMLALMEEAKEVPEQTGSHVAIVLSIVVLLFVIFVIVVVCGLGFDYFRKVQNRRKWRNTCHKGKLPCFQQDNADTPSRNIYVTHQQGSFTTPSMEYYMEIGPNQANQVHPRPQAGPQSACSSIRRKSTAMDYFTEIRHHNAVGTPERPLLTDAQIPHTSPDRASISQHIYVEVGSGLEEGSMAPYQRPEGVNHFQPIQIPILAAGSSNSSQSSGYYSAGMIHRDFPVPHSRTHSPLERPRPPRASSSHQLHASKTMAAESNVMNVSTIAARRRLVEFQDSQFI